MNAALPIYDEAFRFYGVDLSAVPRVRAISSATLPRVRSTSSQEKAQQIHSMRFSL